jgi:hypothetical protein
MKEINHKILRLIIKRCRETITEKQGEELDQWISADKRNKAAYNDILASLLDVIIQFSFGEPDLADLFLRIREKEKNKLIAYERGENVFMYWLVDSDKEKI